MKMKGRDIKWFYNIIADEPSWAILEVKAQD